MTAHFFKISLTFKQLGCRYSTQRQICSSRDIQDDEASDDDGTDEFANERTQTNNNKDSIDPTRSYANGARSSQLAQTAFPVARNEVDATAQGALIDLIEDWSD
jgi:hypothetical protein